MPQRAARPDAVARELPRRPGRHEPRREGPRDCQDAVAADRSAGDAARAAARVERRGTGAGGRRAGAIRETASRRQAEPKERQTAKPFFFGPNGVSAAVAVQTLLLTAATRARAAGSTARRP